MHPPVARPPRCCRRSSGPPTHAYTHIPSSHSLHLPHPTPLTHTPTHTHTTLLPLPIDPPAPPRPTPSHAPPSAACAVHARGLHACTCRAHARTCSAHTCSAHTHARSSPDIRPTNPPSLLRVPTLQRPQAPPPHTCTHTYTLHTLHTYLSQVLTLAFATAGISIAFAELKGGAEGQGAVGEWHRGLGIAVFSLLAAQVGGTQCCALL
jgi:hypothetical protein